MPDTFNSSAAVSAQKKYCEEKKYPHFAPLTGICYNCKKNIYVQLPRGNFFTGISLVKASSSLVTGCPHCNRSYCD